MNAKQNQNLGYIEGWLSALINIVLFALKLWVGVQSRSVAMMADAWHTLSDTLTSGVVLFGFWISNKPADEQHPFGHGRAEMIGAIVISTLLAMVGGKFLIDSFKQLTDFQRVSFDSTAIVVFGISVIIKEGLARFSIWAGRKIESKSLIADGWHHRSDAIASGLIVVGVFVGKYFWWIDGVLGLAVALLIFKAAYEIFRDTSNILMGKRLDHEIADRIKKVIYRSCDADCDPHHIHIHHYGLHKEVTFHLRFPGESTLQEAHDKAKEIENQLRRQLRIEATIHLDPLHHEDLKEMAAR